MLLVCGCLLFLSWVSIARVFSPLTVPKCVNCKFALLHPTLPEYDKCALFPKEKEVKVEGMNAVAHHYFCATARDLPFMCGKEGRMYTSKWETTSMKPLTPLKRRPRPKKPNPPEPTTVKA